MTLEELRAEAERLAEARNDARTPAVVRRALLEPGLTLRGYLALEAMDSPLLGRRPWPVADAGAMAEEFAGAWQAELAGIVELVPGYEIHEDGSVTLEDGE